MFNALFRPVLAKIYDCTLEEVKHHTQKEKRICDTLEPVMGQHRLIFDKGVIESDYHSVESYSGDTAYQYRAIWQMTRITRDRGSLPHDDRIDALAMAVAYWTEQIGKDVDVSVKEKNQELLDQDLEKFMDGIFGVGKKSTGYRWM